MELRAGVRVDRYTLVMPLGEGGQAVVWKVIDPLEGGAVRALKIFQLRGASAQSAERARREAKAVARSHHPGVLPCRSLVEDPAEEVLALVFDYVRGRSLADACSDARMTDWHRRAAVVQLAKTLAHVHGQGLVHRDIKPDNVLVTDDFWGSPEVVGTLKLVDFGIAAPTGNPKPLTREGGVVGTTPYLPPELVDTSGLFEPGDDLRRDVFAFGVLGWEVLFGGHPTGLSPGSSRDAFAGVYLAARAGKRRWPPEAPSTPELAVVRACLAISPAARPASCVAVASALVGPGGGVFVSNLGTGAAEASPPRGSPTDIHVPPTGVLPHHHTSEPAPPRGLPTTARAVAVVVLLLVTGAIGVGAYLLVRAAEAESSPSPGSPPQISPSSSRPPTVAPPPPAATSPVVCCVGERPTCRSGRTCRPGPCDAFVPDGPWRLRVIGGFLVQEGGSLEIQREWQSSQICLKNRRTGEEQCASSKTMWAKGSDPTHRVLATLSDMKSGLIEVRVVDGGATKLQETGFSFPGGFKTTALCDPVTLHLGAWEPHRGKISVYLDDP